MKDSSRRTLEPRRWLGMLAAVVAVLALAVPAAPGIASSLPRTCNISVQEQTYLGASRTWITSWVGCNPGYPIQYNRTQCIYRNVVGTFWYDGPTRKGRGSSSSNYSQVTCNQYPYPSVTQVWIWVNGGGGWTGKRLF